MVKEKFRFTDDENSNVKFNCSVDLTIEPYGYRQGQRIAVINFNGMAEEMTLKEIVLTIYKLKTNCVTIIGECDELELLVRYLQKFINYCKINLNFVGRDLTEPIRLSKVLTTYDKYLDGMDENDTIVLIADTSEELFDAQYEAEMIRKKYKFVGKIFIVHTFSLDPISYEKILNTSLHFKTKYQYMY